MRETISALLLAWYDQNARTLPWRGIHDPYRTWVSETMLQQTRVETVRGYYERFLARFPDVAALAAADEADVLKLWEGLGYYSRARNLHQAARQVVRDFGGEMPREVAQLRQLKGIGAYTAGAIASIAFDQRVPAVDGQRHPRRQPGDGHPRERGHSVRSARTGGKGGFACAGGASGRFQSGADGLGGGSVRPRHAKLQTFARSGRTATRTTRATRRICPCCRRRIRRSRSIGTCC